MLSILIVEDEPLFAQTLKHLVELNPLYSVTARRRGQRSARSPRSPSGGPISPSSISSSPTARPASRSRSKLQRARHSLPVHHRQGAELPDARSRARLPGQAVQRGRSGPRAEGGRGHAARPRGLRLRPSRPGQSPALCRGGGAGRRPTTTGLLPTPDRSSARRTLRDRAGRGWRERRSAASARRAPAARTVRSISTAPCEIDARPAAAAARSR